MSKSASRRAKLFLQLLISACLVAFVFREIDLSLAATLLDEARDLPWLLAALLLFNLSKAVSALRLNLYQGHAGILLGERENLKLYYAGMFLNLLLPGGIGGDGYKILVLHKRQVVPVKTLLWITVFDRVSGMLALLWLAFALLPAAALPWTASRAGAIALAGVGVVAAAMLLAHLRLLKMHVRPAALACTYAFAVQLLQLGCMAALLACFRISGDLYAEYLLIFLVSSLAAALPLSFGGIGARELTFLYGLQWLQIEPTQGVLASTAFFLVTAVSSALGAFFLKGFSEKLISGPA